MQLQKPSSLWLTNYTQLYESNKSRKSIEFQAFQDPLFKKVERNEAKNPPKFQFLSRITELKIVSNWFHFFVLLRISFVVFKNGKQRWKIGSTYDEEIRSEAHTLCAGEIND